MFENEYIGMTDKKGTPVHNGSDVRLYYKGEYIVCKIIYKPEGGMFCLRWPDGYENKWPVDPNSIEVV